MTNSISLAAGTDNDLRASALMPRYFDKYDTIASRKAIMPSVAYCRQSPVRL